MEVIVISAGSGRIENTVHDRSEPLALLVPDPAHLAVDQRRRRHHVAGASREAPFLEGLVIGKTRTINRVIFGRGPPEGTLGAKDEIVGNIGIDACGAAPADLRLAVAFGMEAADPDLALGPEAAQPLGIRLGCGQSHDQCERRNNAGVQSPHDCNPFLVN